MTSEIKKLGKCPYCNSTNYSRYFSELVEDYCVFNCDCKDCEKTFTEYFALDEVKWESGEEEGDEDLYVTSTLGYDNKETLIKALNLLVEKENDTNDYSEIFDKLKGKLKPYN